MTAEQALKLAILRHKKASRGTKTKRFIELQQANFAALKAAKEKAHG